MTTYRGKLVGAGDASPDGWVPTLDLTTPEPDLPLWNATIRDRRTPAQRRRARKKNRRTR